MGTVFCDNCGTSLEETAKFCRACGKPTPLSEAATKRFDEQPRVEPATRPVVHSPTTPAYIPPFEVAPVPQTNELRKNTQRRNLIILGSMLALMILALGGLLAFLNFGVGTPADVPTIPTPPAIESTPPVPPPPGSPPTIEGKSTIDQSLIYPGSRQTMSINREGGKSVLQLQTNDSARKVADWYLARLKVAKKVEVVGQTFLQAGDIGVMIMGGDEGAQILITRGGD